MVYYCFKFHVACLFFYSMETFFGYNDLRAQFVTQDCEEFLCIINDFSRKYPKGALP